MQPPYVFYILAKGNNAGKPALVPWANCFMASCSNQEAKEFYFWLVYGLYNAGRFRVHHHGTAIQFLNIDDVQRVVKEIAPSILPHWQKFKALLKLSQSLNSKRLHWHSKYLPLKSSRSNYWMLTSLKQNLVSKTKRAAVMVALAFVASTAMELQVERAAL